MVRSFHFIVNIPSIILRIALNHSCEDELMSVHHLCTKKQYEEFYIKSLFLFRSVEAETVSSLKSFK